MLKNYGGRLDRFFKKGSKIAKCFHWKKLTDLTAAPGSILKQQHMEKTPPISRLWEQTAAHVARSPT